MNIKTTATTLVRATEIFTDFFKRKPDMTDIDDVKELLSIQCDVIYTMENIDERNKGNDIEQYFYKCVTSKTEDQAEKAKKELYKAVMSYCNKF